MSAVITSRDGVAIDVGEDDGLERCELDRAMGVVARCPLVAARREGVAHAAVAQGNGKVLGGIHGDVVVT